jgi:hydroxymethylpyrimidine pyrophosphatase-like HAD family hydrolase
MRYMCLVTDYDGTIAADSRVSAETVAALEALRKSGRKLIIATGRLLPELLAVFPEAEKLFDRIVAENGAVLYRPANCETKVLCEPPSPQFVEELRRRGLPGLAVGYGIVATWRPHEDSVLQVIRELGLGLQVIFNKSSVMILPSGVNKASGMIAAVEELDLSPHNVVGVGDAENDHTFLSLCECSVAVANSVPSLIERADYVTKRDHGGGVEELVSMLLKDDLASLEPKLTRHWMLLGHEESGAEYRVRPYDTRVAIAGPSGGGKSTTVSALVERLLEAKYQVCVVDPEGDYDDLEQFVTLGGPERVPATSEILEVLKKPDNSLSINLLGISLADRPSFFLGLLPALQELRARTGRPHWIIIDEAHHLVPKESKPVELAMPKEPPNLMLITVHPDHVSRALLVAVNGLLIIGPKPQEVVDQFVEGSGRQLPPFSLNGSENRSGKIVAWMFGETEAPKIVTVAPAKLELKRHRRKYAAGELGEDKSFYFRGPQNKLNLRAQNLNTFIQMAKGVDDETWAFHLQRHDYSQWVREAIKDQALANELRAVEEDDSLPAEESKSRIVKNLEQHYTSPA